MNPDKKNCCRHESKENKQEKWRMGQSNRTRTMASKKNEMKFKSSNRLDTLDTCKMLFWIEIVWFWALSIIILLQIFFGTNNQIKVSSVNVPLPSLIQFSLCLLSPNISNSFIFLDFLLPAFVPPSPTTRYRQRLRIIFHNGMNETCFILKHLRWQWLATLMVTFFRLTSNEWKKSA